MLPAKFTTPLPLPPEEELRRLYLDELLGMGKIAKVYGVGIGTIHKWLHQLEIPIRPSGTNVPMKMQNGLKLRQCRGVLHPEGFWVPDSNFHRYRSSGRVVERSTCKECDDASGARVPFVPFTEAYKAWLKSIINRIGIMETCRRLGVHDKTLRAWRSYRSPKRLRRQHAQAIVRVIRELKITGEVIHRDSIIYGTEVRGLPSKPIKRRSDLYRPHGDHDTSVRRQHRLTS